MFSHKQIHRLFLKKAPAFLCAVLLLLISLAGCENDSRHTASRPTPSESSAADPLPLVVDLDVAALPQYPELPNGCEITSLTAVLNYYGFGADKVDMAQNWLPCAEDGFYGSNPEVEYMGSYPDYDGWYCYETPIMKAANRYLDSIGSTMHAHADTGAIGEQLKQLLAEGMPVIAWCTVGFQQPYYSDYYAWYIDGELFTPFENSHCLVLRGYDDIRGVYLLADPLLYYTEVAQDLFMNVFVAMGSRAVTLRG